MTTAPEFKMPEINIGSPIIIGAVGGSGTRVLARIVSEMGVDIGRDLNQANDDLWMNLLFFRPSRVCSGQFEKVESVSSGMSLMRRHRNGPVFQTTANELRFLSRAITDTWKTDNFGKTPLRWSLKRLAKFFVPIRRKSEECIAWGWKEPTSHFFINQFLGYFPKAKYVHVLRHGLDMAFSSNLNQVKRFGPLFDLQSVTPPDALKFWLAANGDALMSMNRYPQRTMVVRFEDLCSDPSNSVRSLASFLGFRPTDLEIKRMAGYIRPPESIGRYRKNSLVGFSGEDLAELTKFGYSV